MKKFKLAFIATAILLGIGGAFAGKLHSDCSQSPQYYLHGTGYSYAGILGYNYVCLNSPSVCTYYQSGNSYIACQWGSYIYVQLDENK